jgi:formiminotetrahydrofolate cyclodeaminase
VVDKTLYKKLYEAYDNFLKALAKFETNKKQKAYAKQQLKKFLMEYTKVQKELSKVIKKEKQVIK